MNFRDLKYLIAVAEHRHFGKAAEASFVSQPALSMQLKKLEEALGVELFERTNKQVFITEIGNQIVEQAKQILQLQEQLVETAQAARDPYAGLLKLGAFPTLSPYLFPLIVPALHKQFAKLHFQLIEEKTDVLIKQLSCGEIDAAFLALPIDSEQLETQSLFFDPFHLAVPLGHPLAKRKQVTQQELSDQKLLLLAEGHCLRDQALAFCKQREQPLGSDYRATSLETLRQMVIADEAATLIPEIALTDNPHIRYIPFADPVPSREIALVYRKSSVRKTCFQAMIDLIKERL